MILSMLFQIVVSWLVACCILRIFSSALSASGSQFYQEPALLTILLSSIDINLQLKTKLKAGALLHHSFGLFFAAIYYLLWYFEFTEISWTTSLIIGLVNGLISIISWTFLLEVIPSVYINNFKGYYLQLAFVHNLFIIILFSLDQLIV